MITTGVLPDSFKISKIIPLFKKGDSSLLSNYRPISLLPTISKIFERILYNQLYEYFNSNNLLAEQQYGFCSNHSTEYAGVKFVDHISKKWSQAIHLLHSILICLKLLIHYHLTFYYTN